MKPSPKELRLSMRLSNNRIRTARQAQGLSVREACEASGVPVGVWYQYEALTCSPISPRTRTWKPTADALALFLDREPEFFWPDAVLAIVSPLVVTELDAGDQRPELVAVQMRETPLLADEVMSQAELQEGLRRAMRKLSPREENILRRRFGIGSGDGETLHEIGDKWGISSTQVGSIESRALAKLRRELQAHPISEGNANVHAIDAKIFATAKVSVGALTGLAEQRFIYVDGAPLRELLADPALSGDSSHLPNDQWLHVVKHESGFTAAFSVEDRRRFRSY
jgi:RNA polymerase sigma factor (sigma-70 family)